DRVLGERRASIARGRRPRRYVAVAVRVHGDPCTRHAVTRAAVRLPGRNEALDPGAIDVTDADTIAPVDVTHRVGLGVDGVDHVLIGDEDVADPPVHIPGIEVVPLLIEDLDPVVPPVGDPEATL